MEIGTEISKKIRAAIKTKLEELGAYVDEELPDYIMVMVSSLHFSQTERKGKKSDRILKKKNLHFFLLRSPTKRRKNRCKQT